MPMLGIIALIVSLNVGAPQEQESCARNAPPLWAESQQSAEHAYTVGAADTTDEYTFGRIGGLTVDRASRFYVSDLMYSRVQVYGPTGAYIRTIGRAGWGPGEFQAVRSVIAFPDSMLVTRDQRKGLFTIFSEMGVPLQTRRWDGMALRIIQDELQADSLGHFYEARRWTDDRSTPPYILKYDVEDVAGMPDTIALPQFTRGTIEVANAGVGFRGRTYLPLTPDFYWTILPDGRIAMGNGEQYSIKVMNPNGSTVCRIDRAAPRQQVNRQVRSQLFAVAAERIERQAAAAGLPARPFLNQLEVAETYPYVLGLWAEKTGRLWVRVPPTHEGTTVQFDVYSATFDYLGAIGIRDEHLGVVKEFAFSPHYIYAATVDGDGADCVRAYDISIIEHGG